MIVVAVMIMTVIAVVMIIVVAVVFTGSGDERPAFKFALSSSVELLFRLPRFPSRCGTVRG